MLKLSPRIFMIFILFCLLNCTCMADSAKTSVQHVYADWCSAVSEAKGNPAIIVKFYAPGAVLLPTLSPKILINRHGGLNAYFVKFTSHPDIKCMPQKLITQLYGEIAINSGLYDFSYMEKNGKIKIIHARFTFVYKANGTQWLITEHHSSMLPEGSH